MTGAVVSERWLPTRKSLFRGLRRRVFGSEGETFGANTDQIDNLNATAAIEKEGILVWRPACQPGWCEIGEHGRF